MPKSTTTTWAAAILAGGLCAVRGFAPFFNPLEGGGLSLSAMSPKNFEQQVQQRQLLLQSFLNGGHDAARVVEELVASTGGKEDSIVQELPRVEKYFDYSNRERIGHGSNGLVFKASKLATKEMAALKVASASGYALNELVALCKLLKVRSPYLAEYRGAYVDEKGNLVLEMPLYGMNLGALWAMRWIKIQPFLEREILELARQMTEAVRACHASKCVHRDIKPENFVCEKGTDISKIRLVNFSYATHDSAEMKICNESEGVACGGSEGFAAPDVLSYLSWRRPYDYRVDIFSLGVSIRTLALLAPPTAQDVETLTWRYREELRELVEVMTDSDRDKRPSLDSVLTRIDEMLANKSAPMFPFTRSCEAYGTDTADETPKESKTSVEKSDGTRAGRVPLPANTLLKRRQ